MPRCQKRQYDRRKRTPKFTVHDWVWRLVPTRQKLVLNWHEPYLVIEHIGEVNYKIHKSPKSKQIVVHVDHLKPYLGDLTPQNRVLERNAHANDSIDGRNLYNDNAQHADAINPIEPTSVIEHIEPPSDTNPIASPFGTKPVETPSEADPTEPDTDEVQKERVAAQTSQ